MPADLNITAGVRERLEADLLAADRAHDIAALVRREDLRAILAALPSAGPAPVVGSVEERVIIHRTWDELVSLCLEGGSRYEVIVTEADLSSAMSLAFRALTLPEQATADWAGEEAAPSDAQIIRNAIAAWEEVYPDLPPPKNGEVTRYEDLEFGPLNDLRSLRARLAIKGLDADAVSPEVSDLLTGIADMRGYGEGQPAVSPPAVQGEDDVPPTMFTEWALTSRAVPEGKGNTTPIPLEQLQALLEQQVDVHDLNESLADACDMADSAAWHEERRKKLTAAIAVLSRQSQPSGADGRGEEG